MKMRWQICEALMSLLIVIGAPVQANAQTAAETYKSKCAGCHASDGSGSAIGKKLGARDFHSADVQKESDAELTDAIAKGRNKMPAYEKSLKADEIKQLVSYIRSLGTAR